jgi:Ca2+-binding RTX toxin-like protein
MSIHRLISLLFIAAAFSGALGTGTLASAATIGINGSILTATAEPSGDQVLIGYTTGMDLTLVGISFNVVTPGCVDQGSTVCSLSGLTEFRIVMGSGDDVVDLTGVAAIAGLVISVIAGDGNDILLAPSGGSRMWGGAGDDILFPVDPSASSCLSGGTGDNVVIGSVCDPGPEPVFPPAQPVSVPEPATLALFGLGLVGVVAYALPRWR